MGYGQNEHVIVKVDNQELKNKQPIFLTDYGVSHVKTAAVNTPLFQQAIDDAQLSSRPIIAPWVPDGQWLNIDAPLVINTGGISITGYGRQTRIRQNTFPNPVFDVLGSDTTIENMFLACVDFNASGYTNLFRGEPLQVYNSGVQVGADRVTVRNIKVDNMIAGVHVAAWDVALNAVRATTIQGVVVDNIEVSNVDFGIVIVGVNNFRFSNLRGSYRLMPGSPTSPHLIYFSETLGNNSDVIGSNCMAYDGTVSFAYQFKAIRGGEISQLFARNCVGVLHLMDCNDMRFKGITSLDDMYNDLNYASVHLDTQNSNISINDITLRFASNGKPVHFSAGTTDSTIKNAFFETKHTTAASAHRYDVELRGTGNSADNVCVKSIGTSQHYGSIGIWEGTKNTISRPKTAGNQRGVVVRSGTGHKLRDYSLDDIEFVSGAAGARKVEVLVSTQLNPVMPSGIGSYDRLLAFDRADVIGQSQGIISLTTSGHAWTQSFGTFKAIDGRIYSEIGANSLAFINLATPNLELSAGVKYANREFLAIRATDKDNLIGARLNHTTNMAQIYKRVSGVDTVLAETAFIVAIGRRYKLLVQVYNDVIDFYVDGKQMVSCTLASADMTQFGAITNHGIGGNANVNGLFDNIEWRSLE